MSTSLQDKYPQTEFTEISTYSPTSTATQPNSLNYELCCTLHKDKQIEYYCQSCKSPVCSVCMFETHNGHRLVMLSDELDHYKNLIQSLKQSLTDLNRKNKDKLDLITENIDTLQIQKQNQIKIVLKLFNDITNKIEQKRDLVISGFDQKYEMTLDKIENIKKTIQCNQNELNIILNAVDGLLKSFDELSQEIMIKKIDSIINFITKSSNDIETCIKKQNMYMKKFEKVSKLNIIPVNAKHLMELLDKIDSKVICYPELDDKERDAIEVKIKNNLLIRDVEKQLNENRPQKIIFDSPQSRTKISHALPLCPKLNGSVLTKHKTSKLSKNTLNMIKSNSNSKLSTNVNTSYSGNCNVNNNNNNHILNTEQSPLRIRSKFRLKSIEQQHNNNNNNNNSSSGNQSNNNNNGNRIVSAIITTINSNKPSLHLQNINKHNKLLKRTASESSYRTINKTETKEDLQYKRQNNNNNNNKQNNNDKDSLSINGSYYNTNSNNNNNTTNNNESSSSSYQGSGSIENNSSMEQSFNLLDHDKQGKKQSLLYLQYRPNMNLPPSTNQSQILPLINKK